MELFRKSCAFADAHRAELLAEYPDQWIGVFDGEIRAHDQDLHRLLAQLDALGVPRRALFTQFLDTNPLPMML